MISNTNGVPVTRGDMRLHSTVAACVGAVRVCVLCENWQKKQRTQPEHSKNLGQGEAQRFLLNITHSLIPPRQATIPHWGMC